MDSAIFKIFFIGDKEVGRRTFLREFIDQYFHEGHIDTIGVEIYKKELTIEGKIFHLLIYHISNKEIWEHLFRPYIDGSNAAILMFDLTNSKSLDYLSEFPQMIRGIAGEIPILLLGNKVDLTKDRTVSREEGLAFARSNNFFRYIEISAKTGQNCDVIFKLLAENIIAQLQIS